VEKICCFSKPVTKNTVWVCEIWKVLTMRSFWWGSGSYTCSYYLKIFSSRSYTIFDRSAKSRRLSGLAASSCKHACFNDDSLLYSFLFASIFITSYFHFRRFVLFYVQIIKREKSRRLKNQYDLRRWSCFPTKATNVPNVFEQVCPCCRGQTQTKS